MKTIIGILLITSLCYMACNEKKTNESAIQTTNKQLDNLSSREGTVKK